MLEGLKIELHKAYKALVLSGLVRLRWGNISARDTESGNIVIKPSNTVIERLMPSDMIVCDAAGKVLEGKGRPSHDLMTQIELYNAFPGVHSIVHTHSKWATVFAQAGEPIPNLGTTHADMFQGDIPLTRSLTPYEISKNYYTNIGRVIVEAQHRQDPLLTPAVLVRSHGPFVWGVDVEDAVEHAIALEYVADITYHTLRLNTDVDMNEFLIDEHTQRKQERAEKRQTRKMR